MIGSPGLNKRTNARWESALADRLNAMEQRANAVTAFDLSRDHRAEIGALATDTLQLVEAIRAVLGTRDDLTLTARVLTAAAHRWKAEGRKLRFAFHLGRSYTRKEDAALVEEALIAAFDLWSQYEGDVTDDP